jgi:hypothetical protein
MSPFAFLRHSVIRLGQVTVLPLALLRDEPAIATRLLGLASSKPLQIDRPKQRL